MVHLILRFDVSSCLFRVGKSSPIIHYVQNIWKRDGFRGFYRGLSASYAGKCVEMC